MHDGVTISQAAGFAGVTVKTVRHYHRLGLVPEPERDSSGYRRYAASDLLRLVQARTLAAAGVPLGEISPLLDADDEHFAAEIVDVERRLTARIDELIERRKTLRRLAEGDRALLPDRAIAVLDSVAAQGIDAEEIAAMREGLILAKALVPEGFDEHLAHIEHALRDPEFLEMSRRAAEAAHWHVDDPRIPGLAEELAAHYLADPDRLAIVSGLQARTDTAARYGMLRDFGVDEQDAGTRLVQLIEARMREAGVRIPR